MCHRLARAAAALRRPGQQYTAAAVLARLRHPRTLHANRRAASDRPPRSPPRAPVYAAAGAGEYGGNSGAGSLQGPRRRRGRSAALLGRSKAEWSGAQGQGGSAGVGRAHPPRRPLRSVLAAAAAAWVLSSSCRPLHHSWTPSMGAGSGAEASCLGFAAPPPPPPCAGTARSHRPALHVRSHRFFKT